MHPVLRKEGKKHLIDVYYEESQMNKWRDNCIRTNESALSKYERADKEYHSFKVSVLDTRKDPKSEEPNEHNLRDLSQKLHSLVSDTNPLLISIISTVYENIKEMHNHLNALCRSDPQQQEVRQAQTYFANIEGLKKKMKEHQELAGQMEEHQKALELLVDQAVQLKARNAAAIAALNKREVQYRSQMKKANVSFENIKYFSDLNVRVEKDFNYLKHPAQLPDAYEKALLEVTRRKKFRRHLDEKFKSLQELVAREKALRENFLTNLGKVLPSDFIPQLREQTPALRLEGGVKDYDLPEIDEGGDYEFDADARTEASAVKVGGLEKELVLLREEHAQNVKDLNAKIEAQETQLMFKTAQAKELNQALSQKDRETAKQKEELEKALKSLKDQAVFFQHTQKLTEESLAKKTKELEALAKSKNCKNCILCVEDLRGKPEAVLVKDLNDKLMEKNKQISSQEEQVRKSAALISQICQHNFNFLRQKTQDFYKAQDRVKAAYENRLKDHEE